MDLDENMFVFPHKAIMVLSYKQNGKSSKNINGCG